MTVRIALLDSGGSSGSASPAWTLARQLADRSHELTVIGAEAWRSDEEGVTPMRLSRPPASPARRFYEDDVDLAPAAIRHLLARGFDVAHAFSPALGWAAVQAQRLGGPGVVYSFRGRLTRRWLVDRAYRLEMLLATAQRAAVCTVDDSAAGISFRRYLLREPTVVDGATSVEQYEELYERALSQSG